MSPRFFESWTSPSGGDVAENPLHIDLVRVHAPDRAALALEIPQDLNGQPVNLRCLHGVNVDVLALASASPELGFIGADPSVRISAAHSWSLSAHSLGTLTGQHLTLDP